MNSFWWQARANPRGTQLGPNVMTLTIKDSLNLANPNNRGLPSQNSENKAGESPRSNPVCLEVIVTVRRLPGEDGNRPGSAEPTREQGRTVIVFDNGAVLRLSNNLPAGQKLILSNAQGRDVVCRVVKGQNLPSVKGYIEVEFVEQVNDFWRIHQSAEPAGVAETAKFSLQAPVLATPPATSAAAPTAPTAIVPPPAPAAAERVATPEKVLSIQSDSAPSFDDIAGLVRMSRTSPSAVKASVPAVSMRARSSKDEAEHGQSEPDFSSTISAPNPMPHMTSTTRAIPLAQEFSSPPVQKPTPSNVFMAGGILASGQTSSVSSSAEGRRLMPLIVGGAALLLAGFGGGYFYMHQGSGPAPATSAILATQPPAQGLSAMPSDAAGQVAAEQVPTQPAVATVAREAEISATTDAQQNVRRAPGNADEKQPDRPAKQRQQIPGLKMKSPSAPKQNLAKIPDGIAPSITDVSSAIAVPGAPGAAMLAPVVRSENQPAPPLSLGIAGPSAKTIREPRLVSATRPVYPAVARQASTQGTVVVTAMVDAKGTITDVKAVSGPAALRQAAIDSVKQWKYSPALIDGKPASAQITVDVQFRLN